MTAVETLVVIDDDSASALSLQALLEAHDYEVRIFRSAEDFLRDCEVGGRPPSCLLLDLRLPGMSGLELQRELAARGSRLPIVMISGHADKTSHDQAMKCGAAAVLQKPFSGAELRDAIRGATGA